jgi:hypothetical protein
VRFRVIERRNLLDFDSSLLVNRHALWEPRPIFQRCDCARLGAWLRAFRLFYSRSLCPVGLAQGVRYRNHAYGINRRLLDSPPFQILEGRGFEVKLANARHVKHVSGRKTDLLDSQWLQKLHTYGLSSGSFRPQDSICILRSFCRRRGNLIQYAAAHVQHMQKALTEMNIHLHKAITDITVCRS